MKVRDVASLSIACYPYSAISLAASLSICESPLNFCGSQAVRMSVGGAGLMSCVREGSLEPPYRPPHADTNTHGEGRTGRFLRGLRRMFKRRQRSDSPDHKSSSTSELLDPERQRRKEGAYGSGLSVSHDSVFTGERSGDESSDERATHTRSHVASHRSKGNHLNPMTILALYPSPPASPTL
ncbi:hypothetical protein KGM_207430 [Danaus plexippus plexippus]|uniref:Uncharacterized protein n=1 Tax=Danaus plexippus plexippus TaxID=278856 RepID=A0A212EU17_DANPL|nr:hypothetical protein KGM_207430 [Danaus plexippus plexippus]